MTKHYYHFILICKGAGIFQGSKREKDLRKEKARQKGLLPRFAKIFRQVLS